MIALSFFLSLQGFLHLSMVLSRHAKDCLGSTFSTGQARWLRLLGWAFLLASLWPCIRIWGGEIGVCAWFGLLVLSMVCTTFLVSQGPVVASYLWRRVCPGGYLFRCK